MSIVLRLRNPGLWGKHRICLEASWLLHVLFQVVGSMKPGQKDREQLHRKKSLLWMRKGLEVLKVPHAVQEPYREKVQACRWTLALDTEVFTLGKNSCAMSEAQSQTATGFQGPIGIWGKNTSALTKINSSVETLPFFFWVLHNTLNSWRILGVDI